MLPTQHKLTSPVQFRRAIKGGKRAGSRTVVVHVHVHEHQSSTANNAEIAATGPRFGLVVSKAVGNAVVRHRTSRRLRHICMALVADSACAIPPDADIVIRALPASGGATSAQLEKDMRKALRKVWGT